MHHEVNSVAELKMMLEGLPDDAAITLNGNTVQAEYKQPGTSEQSRNIRQFWIKEGPYL